MGSVQSQVHQPIEELEVFRAFEEIATWCWSQIESWKPHHRDTVGRQLIRAIDSVGANLVEGDGRYSSADALHFFIVARGSAREARLWLERAKQRSLVSREHAEAIEDQLVRATKLLNLLINYRRSKVSPVPKRVRETVGELRRTNTDSEAHS
ncbi:MAG TPA: four helix bundle protein [Fimbriimonadaceae bacterium]|nr:four helix bundle protein [Fimbriimonadaceae bacterium]